MAVYTCYDMIRDCPAGRAEGWTHFVRTFAPACLTILSHYGGAAAEMDRLLAVLRGGQSPFLGLPGMPERELLVHLRPTLLGLTPARTAGAPPDFELVAAALNELSPIERQMAWLETMDYPVDESAVLLGVSPETVARLRTRAGEMLRAGLDSWQAGMLAAHGRALGLAAEAAVPERPLAFRDFTDLIDGRVTWQRRQAIDHALSSSWFEVHRLCIIREADGALVRSRTLSEEQSARFLAACGVSSKRPPLWKKIFAAR